LGKVVPIKENRNDHTKLLNIEIKVEFIEHTKKVTLIKIIFIEMVMDIHLLRLELEHTENHKLVTSFPQDTDKKELLV